MPPTIVKGSETRKKSASRPRTEEAGSAEDIDAVATALEGMEFKSQTGTVTMREQDHQLLQPMYISVMDTDAKYDADNSGVGFRTVANIPVEQATDSTSCEMKRP